MQTQLVFLLVSSNVRSRSSKMLTRIYAHRLLPRPKRISTDEKAVYIMVHSWCRCGLVFCNDIQTFHYLWPQLIALFEWDSFQPYTPPHDEPVHTLSINQMHERQPVQRITFSPFSTIKINYPQFLWQQWIRMHGWKHPHQQQKREQSQFELAGQIMPNAKTVAIVSWSFTHHIISKQ